MKRIGLKFNKSTTRLAGFPYGESIYREQVKDKVMLGESVTIVFPNQIEKIASSFVQGFFSAFVEAIGYRGIDEKIKIEAGTPALEESIRKNIY